MSKTLKGPKQITLVNFILDKSGSMESVKESTISGFNEYLQSLKSDGNEYEFSLTLFDTTVTKKYVGQPLSEIQKLDKDNYNTSGGTALYDAACSTIKEVKDKLKDGVKVLTVIMTDGEENSSKEYSQVQFSSLVKELQGTDRWSFVFLGANQDSWANAQKFGFNQGNVINFTASASGTRAAFNMMSSNTKAFAGAAEMSTQSFFSKDDQANLEATK